MAPTSDIRLLADGDLIAPTVRKPFPLPSVRRDSLNSAECRLPNS